MVHEALSTDRQIVTCDDCGTPYPAVVEEGDLVLVGPESGACPNCGGVEFSRLAL
jgi:predicted RNA-binding Zn-ribbon protein involved in translation (DUF1610 family)